MQLCPSLALHQVNLACCPPQHPSLCCARPPAVLQKLPQLPMALLTPLKAPLSPASIQHPHLCARAARGLMPSACVMVHPGCAGGSAVAGAAAGTGKIQQRPEGWVLPNETLPADEVVRLRSHQQPQHQTPAVSRFMPCAPMQGLNLGLCSCSPTCQGHTGWRSL